MNKWRKKMKEKRLRRNQGEHFSLVDFLLEILIWIPEILIFPFRLVFWLFRGLGKLIGDVWDFIH
ncbi:hypothetical protein I7V34_14730 [Bacillus sp. V3]|nr:hypothetical protein I7V34_14730 [Bacillus sp. V3]